MFSDLILFRRSKFSTCDACKWIRYESSSAVFAWFFFILRMDLVLKSQHEIFFWWVCVCAFLRCFFVWKSQKEWYRNAMILIIQTNFQSLRQNLLEKKKPTAKLLYSCIEKETVLNHIVSSKLIMSLWTMFLKKRKK